MKKSYALIILVISFLVAFIFSLPYLPDYFKKKIIGETEAVKIAEQFVCDTGYSTVHPNRIFSDLVVPTEMVPKMHNHPLEEKAFGIVHNKLEGSGWCIIFKYKDRRPPNMGRAVLMDKYGQKLWIFPQRIYLYRAEKRL